MSAERTITGKDWHAFYREDHSQWVLKYRRGACNWGQHRVPPKYQLDADVRRYVKAWLDETRRVNGTRTTGTVVRPAGGLDPQITFKEFGELWTNGDLARRFPDHVRPKKSASDDASRLRKWVYETIGHVPVRDFAAPHGLELVRGVMAALPARLTRATRRHVAQLMHKLLAMAWFPAELLPSEPLPKGFMPKLDAPKAATFLYPDEDAALLKSSKVSLGYRLFWGFEDREGPRAGEALRLAYEDFDLERGIVCLDENKTDDPRSWALSPGVVQALRAWKERYFPNAGPTDKVFREVGGSPLDERDHLAERLREHLELAGVKRAQLFKSSENRRHIWAHDLRATFITISLATGKSETWISDRTGHKSSVMIQRYNRNKRMLEQLNLGELKPLDQAIPELSSPPEQAPNGAQETDLCPSTGSRLVQDLVQGAPNLHQTALHPTPNSPTISASTEGGTRTLKVFPPTDFESAAFAIPPLRLGPIP